MAELKVIGLHCRPDLLESAAVLLNREWPRSLEARKHSIKESCPELPLSLLLINDNDEVIGHVRVLKVAADKDNTNAGLIESLVIASKMRRRGLGRRLMEAAEEHVKRLGYLRMHLSTHDQHVFYRRIGYQESTPVNAVRKCTVTFKEKQTEFEVSDPNSETVITQTEPNSTSDRDILLPLASPPPLAPPPPAPPPPPANTIRLDQNTMTKWYIKYL